MTQPIQNFDGFSEPLKNYTKIPNEFFDKILIGLKPPEVKVLLFIMRQTWGWHRAVAWIPLSQFTQTGPTRRTIQAAIESLMKKELVLRFDAGQGSNRRNYYLLKTPGKRKLLEDLATGKITMEQFLASLPPPPEDE